MFSWAITFLIFALIAGLFGFSGLAGTAVNIAWLLFVVGLVLRPTGCRIFSSTACFPNR